MGRNNRLGVWGERQAAEYLRRKGYDLLVHSYRSRFGEIDLIVSNGKILVFVEVKLRKSADFARAMEYVDQRKQEKLRITAEYYLTENPAELPCRFDVVEIYAPEGENSRRLQIHHLEDAFT